MKVILAGTGILALLLVVAGAAGPSLVAQNGAAASPPATSVASNSTAAATPALPPKAKALLTRSVSGGGVDVTVTPLTLVPGRPATFDVAMNTHSVELADDMVASATLRDGAGREVSPLAWKGPGPGGHHREGVLQFPELPDLRGGVTLVIKNVANVPVREFSWTG